MQQCSHGKRSEARETQKKVDKKLAIAASQCFTSRRPLNFKHKQVSKMTNFVREIVIGERHVECGDEVDQRFPTRPLGERSKR
jgi:hypothetical protein